eukprot:4117629-Alexandrium_andersonii.AAC.2
MERSTAFYALLPGTLSDEQVARLEQWGARSCEGYRVTREGAHVRLVAVRERAATVRELQRLLRTNLRNWGVELPPKQSGWLGLLEVVAAEDPTADGARPAPPAADREQTPTAHRSVQPPAWRTPAPAVTCQSLLRPPANLLRKTCSK